MLLIHVAPKCIPTTDIFPTLRASLTETWEMRLSVPSYSGFIFM